MADNTAIEWTDATWNPVTGCTKIGAGCDHCYAERFAERFRGTHGHPFETGFDLTLRPERLEQPLRWQTRRMIFVNSMSDLFHKGIPEEFIARVFETMERAPWHTFQVLTKRSSLMRKFLRGRYGNQAGPVHMWFGVSVEDGSKKSRIRHLQQAPAGTRFLSIEPLIGPVGKLDLTGIDWVIVGGESGPGARPMQPDWVRDVREQCLMQGTAFFFKQWGGFRPKSGGRELDGREWNDFPKAAPADAIARWMKSSPQVTVGPWAKEKLEALGQYLNFYTTVLKNQGHWLKGTIFVDAFAGPGVARVRMPPPAPASPGLFGSDPEPDAEEVEFVKGSPRVALEITNPFSSYIFIDRNPQRIAELQALKAEYPSGLSISIHEGDANAALQAWLASGIDWRHHRAVVFLDPFGMQVPWSTVGALARTKAIEVLINFPLGMAIQRLMTRSGEIPTGWQMSLDTFFGAPDWRDLVYEQEVGLFGQGVRKVSDSSVKLLEWYRSRLRAAFGHVSTARLIKNTRGNPLYYLIWAGPHPRALKGAEHILSKGERLPGGSGSRRQS